MARGKQNKWYPFDAAKGSRQALPPEKRMVLVCTTPEREGWAPATAVAYLKYGAGDRQSPYFVVVGVGHNTVTHWNDCLGDDFEPPCWQMKQPT